jgi:GTP-binding protein
VRPKGAGLGHQFLRHLQRTKVLLHLVDMAPFDESIDPAAEVKAIAAELVKYDASLAKKTRWLVFNKADLLAPTEAKKRAAALVKKLRWTKPWFLISAVKAEGTRELSFAVMDYLEGKSDARGVRREK